MPDFVTLGETCAVFVGKNGGPLRYSMEFERRVGGAETTVAVGVARLGHQAGWISRLGDDEFGNYILGVMRGEDVDVSTVKRSSAAQTGVFFRENRASGRSSVFYYRQNSAFSKFLPEDLDDDDQLLQNITLLAPNPTHSSAEIFPLLSLSLEIGQSTVSVKMSNTVPPDSDVWNKPS